MPHVGDECGEEFDRHPTMPHLVAICTRPKGHEGGHNNVMPKGVGDGDDLLYPDDPAYDVNLTPGEAALLGLFPVETRQLPPGHKHVGWPAPLRLDGTERSRAKCGPQAPESPLTPWCPAHFPESYAREDARHRAK